MKKNNKGFTLIELLAVIVILALLMMIAIPSVTRYITQSRVKTLTKTMDSYMTAVVNQVNDGEYKFSDSGKIFAIPIECVALEKGGDNPLGNWSQSNSEYWAYVLVHYDNENYTYQYGFTFKDDAGYGMYPTISANIDEKGSQVKTGYDDLTQPQDGKAVEFVPLEKWEGFTNITAATELVVLDATLEGGTGDGYDTCTLCQKGDNYSDIAESKIPANAVAITSAMSEAEAVNILTSNSNVVLKGNVSLPNSIVLTRDVNVYSDGDYTMNFGNGAFIKGTGTMTMKSGNLKTGKEFQVTENASLVIASGTHSFGLLSISGNGVLTVNGGILSTHGYGSCGDIVMGANATLNVNGGKLIFDGGWDWEINLTGNNKSSHKPTNVRVNITGGEIDAVSGVVISIRKSLNNASNTHVNISGGTFRNTYMLLMDWDAWSAVTWGEGIATVTGGRFYFPEGATADYMDYIASGYKAVTNADGSVSVVKE